MPTKELKHNNTHSSETHLEAWIPTIIPTLKTCWADYLFGIPANQPTPNFSDWLALIHAAVATPDKLPHYLSKLLKFSQNDVEPPSDWVILTDLLALTFEAAKTEADKLTNTDWQNLVEIQNCILKAAAQVSANRKAHPTTGTLTRRALYLQIVTKLNKKIVAITDPNELLDEIVVLIRQEFGYEYINIFLLDSTKQTLMLQNAVWKTERPKPEDLITLDLEQGIVGRVAATGQGVLVNDVSQNPNFFAHPALPDIKSQLAMPLMTGTDMIGVLDVESEQVDAFSEDDRQILQALAGHIAIAITNVRLQQMQQRYMQEQTLIYDSIMAMGTGLDMNTVLKSISKKITKAVNAGACVICQVDEEAQTITALSEYVLRHPGNPPHTWRKLNTPIHIAKDPICRQVLQATRPVISRAKPAKNTTSPLIWRAPADSVGDKLRWNVVLALPFETKMRITGLIEIYDKDLNRTFSSEDVQLCRILATQTALAMEQTRLFDETLSRLNEVSKLHTMAQKISSSLDLEDVLNTIVTSLREAIGCRACCIFLLDESDTQLEIKAADGLKPQWRKMAKLQIGEGAAGMAAAEGRTIYLPDTRKDPTFVFFDKEVRSLMVVPLMAQGKIIGTINVDDNKPNAFGSTQERLLTIAAAQAGVTIENARLFSRIATEQQQMQAIIQHMADGLLLINKRGVIITCNSTLAMMLGINRHQMVGQNINSPNLHPNLAGITASATRHARTGVLAKEVAIETPRPRTLQVFTTLVTNDNKNIIGEVLLVHDVTKERELEQLKDDFISTISHELRTPLFSIQGFAQLMLEEDNLDPETYSEFLTTIQRQARQLSEMVNNLLDLSKFDEGKLALEKKPLSLLDLMNQTILQLQGYAHQQKVKLIPKLPASLPTIEGDKQRLEQVLTNLIGNAIKFSKTDDEVIITTSLNNTEILIEVKDQGIGIPPDALDRIFSRYYQVHDKNERSAMGSGLGLHIAKKIVEGHGGRIWAESEAGHGSTFCFTLPLSKTSKENT